MSWTDEKVQKLKELWKKGHTASQISEMLGDTTRNAVIGKAHRLNLEARAPSKSSSAQELVRFKIEFKEDRLSNLLRENRSFNLYCLIKILNLRTLSLSKI